MNIFLFFILLFFKNILFYYLLLLFSNNWLTLILLAKISSEKCINISYSRRSLLLQWQRCASINHAFVVFSGKGAKPDARFISPPTSARSAPSRSLRKSLATRKSLTCFENRRNWRRNVAIPHFRFYRRHASGWNSRQADSVFW